jgi:transposase
VFQDTASVLFGVEGLQVTDAESGAGGTLEVWAVTDHAAARACPDCGTVSGRVHEQVLTRPRDVARGLDAVQVRWVKRRWKCETAECGRKTFTEWVPQVPPRCRLTGRLRELAVEEIVERGITPAEAARGNGMSWPVAHDAFAARAGPLLEQPPAAVEHLGIDEHRRGRPRWKLDEDTGEYILLADRWHTCFFDLSGQQGLLGQVEGRTADDAAYWLAQATPAWRDAVRVVAIDMCTIYASAVRRMLPGAQLVADLFHVVPPGGQDDRGRAPPGGAGQVRPPGPVRRPGVRHQGTAGPVNQRRRVRTACTRDARRRSRHPTRKRTRSVTGRQHDPG